MGYNAREVPVGTSFQILYMMVRTRIAPSPTGYPHIGTIYQALFDFAFAKKHKGKFIIRIEDTDRERFVVDAEEKLYEAFDWFGLQEDESPRKGGPFAPYKQSERLDIYKKYALELVDKRDAYYCFCTKERLEEMREALQKEKKQLMYDGHCHALSQNETAENLLKNIPYVIRLKVPKDTAIVGHDEIRGDISFESNTVDDQVLLKSDGFPTYHLASVVDDHLMEITHIVRGEEWITSTPKHVLLYQFFGWEMPKLFHTPLLRNPDKTKLSKRHGHTNVAWYQEQGFLPEAVLNFLAMLGWSNPQDKEIFSLDEFITQFDLKDLKPVGPIFDLVKLAWLNGMWIRQLPAEDIKKRLLAYYANDSEMFTILESDYIQALLPLVQTRMKTLQEFKELVVADISYIYSDDEKKLATELLQTIEHQEVWLFEQILVMLKNFNGKHGISMKTQYVLLTGRKQGLPLPSVMEIFGKLFYINHLKKIA